MRNKLALIFSFILTVLGVVIPESSLAMMPLENGELVIPRSLGANDPFIIKFALSSFSVSLFYSAICLVFNKWHGSIIYIFAINSIVYLLYTVLILLNSSFIIAAKHGNWIPLSQFAVWISFILIIAWLSFDTNTFKKHKN
ncbi:MAG: hypothetical protein HWE16_09650 [Gammaproteobacteria bacterium]|nr:hypothetical protein [Gammaproteobacteria bacterium]